MTQHRSFVRKIIYLVAIVVILLVLVWLGQPATGRVAGKGEGTEEKGTEGGWLAQLRHEYGFGESDLGDVDPAGETMKLATLGLRGVAVNLLWEKSNSYKMKKDWTNLKATLNQIIHLEPHFTKVWNFQAWNLSYNVSAEHDDYRARYHWVIEGIEFLKKGILVNRNDPLMYKEVGWFISQKIGRADEWVQFRKLFKADDDFHREDDFFPGGPPEDRDNWLVGKAWYHEAEKFVERDEEHPERWIRKTTPVVFWAYKPMCQMNYCETLAKEGVFDEKAGIAWTQAITDWVEFGSRQLPTVPLPGFPSILVQLNQRELWTAKGKEALEKLEKLQPGLRKKIEAERLAALTPAERKAYDMPSEKRTSADWQALGTIQQKLRVSHDDVAYDRRIPADKRAEAYKLAKDAFEAERMRLEIDSQRRIVNYDYWKRRADVEQTREALDARRALYQAQKAADDQHFSLAAELYTEAFKKWRQVLDNPKWPDLIDQEQVGSEWVDFIRDYRKVLEKQLPKQEFPKKFILQDVLTRHEANTPEKD